jgi:hypothetical protein
MRPPPITKEESIRAMATNTFWRRGEGGRRRGGGRKKGEGAEEGKEKGGDKIQQE